MSEWEIFRLTPRPLLPESTRAMSYMPKHFPLAPRREATHLRPDDGIGSRLPRHDESAPRTISSLYSLHRARDNNAALFSWDANELHFYDFRFGGRTRRVGLRRGVVLLEATQKKNEKRKRKTLRWSGNSIVCFEYYMFVKFRCKIHNHKEIN